MRMLQAVTGCVMASAITATGLASVIDDFSVDTSGKYNVIDAYNGTGSYAISNGQFVPDMKWTMTNYFLRNDGYALNAGDSVSIDLIKTGVSLNPAIGLALSTSLGGVENSSEILVYKDNVAGENKYRILNVVNGSDFLWDRVNPLTLTITRTLANDASYDVTLAGAGFATINTSFTNNGTAGKTVYFGAGIFSGSDGAGGDYKAQILDNLGYTSIPEPTTMGLLSLAGLACLRRRRQA